MLTAEWTDPVTTFLLFREAACSRRDPYVRAERGWGSCGGEGAPSLVPPRAAPTPAAAADELPAGVTPVTQLTAVCPRLGEP